MLERVAISSSRRSSQFRDQNYISCISCFDSVFSFVVVVQSPSRVQLFATPGTAACQASLSLTISQSLPKFTFIALVMWWSHPSSDALFSFCPQSFQRQTGTLISERQTGVFAGSREPLSTTDFETHPKNHTGLLVEGGMGV